MEISADVPTVIQSHELFSILRLPKVCDDVEIRTVTVPAFTVFCFWFPAHFLIQCSQHRFGTIGNITVIDRISGIDCKTIGDTANIKFQVIRGPHIEVPCKTEPSFFIDIGR